MKVINFETEDKITLYGILYNTENIGKIVISVHGMSTNIFKKREEIFSNELNNNNISYFCFNNRGHDIMNYKHQKGNDQEIVCGTAFEDVTQCYYDIKAAIKKVEELGYKEIYLQGHSLGSTKVLYAYNKLKNEKSEYIKNIKGIILLSLVDIPSLMKIYLGENFEKALKYAESREDEKNQLMPPKTFVNPISVKTFLQYVKYNKEINFLQYSNKNYEYEVLNNIDLPICIRWGNNNEFIQIPADLLTNLLEVKIKTNKPKDIGYIDGANHHYTGKEKILANEVIKFVKSN